MNLFYSINIESENIILTEEESRHCIKVMRMSTGDTIYVTDGKGNLYECLLTDENIKGLTAKIVNKLNALSTKHYSLNIAIAPTKNINRLEWFLEKSTEIGIDLITPIICDHSERKVINSDRLEKILVAAMKQSNITHLPVLNQLITFKDFILNYAKTKNESLKFIAICDETLTKPLKNIYEKGNNCVILIGPEGDFSKAESELAMNNGFIPVSLSKNRLRTETAALIACNLINFINE